MLTFLHSISFVIYTNTVFDFRDLGKTFTKSNTLMVLAFFTAATDLDQSIIETLNSEEKLVIKRVGFKQFLIFLSLDFVIFILIKIFTITKKIEMLITKSNLNTGLLKNVFFISFKTAMM